MDAYLREVSIKLRSIAVGVRDKRPALAQELDRIGREAAHLAEVRGEPRMQSPAELAQRAWGLHRPPEYGDHRLRRPLMQDGPADLWPEADREAYRVEWDRIDAIYKSETGDAQLPRDREHEKAIIEKVLAPRWVVDQESFKRCATSASRPRCACADGACSSPWGCATTIAPQFKSMACPKCGQLLHADAGASFPICSTCGTAPPVPALR